MFENKDKDLDGRLSFEEFMGEESRAERLFKLMDKDNDGWVTKHVSGHWSVYLGVRLSIAWASGGEWRGVGHKRFIKIDGGGMSVQLVFIEELPVESFPENPHFTNGYRYFLPSEGR